MIIIIVLKLNLGVKLVERPISQVERVKPVDPG
jgi:hypothetical protein